MPTGDSEPDGKGRSVSDRAYHSLRQLILRGEFAPGEHLSGQRLSQMLGISRTPVRTALVRLEAEGLIETEAGQSMRVRLITASEVEQAFDVAGGLRVCSSIGWPKARQRTNFAISPVRWRTWSERRGTGTASLG